MMAPNAAAHWLPLLNDRNRPFHSKNPSVSRTIDKPLVSRALEHPTKNVPIVRGLPVLDIHHCRVLHRQ